MAYKFHGSSEGHRQNLALFSPPPVDTATERVEWIDTRPIGQISQRSTVEFNIPGEGMDYIDLKQTRLYTKV